MNDGKSVKPRAARCCSVRAAILLALALLALAGCSEQVGAPEPPRNATGAAPSWSFTDTEGRTHTANGSNANATVLFFMATWCPSCKRTAPALADVHEEYAPRGLRTLSVTVDPSESAGDLERWQAEYAQPWPHGIDATLDMQETFGIRSQSSVVLLDAEGQVARSWGYGQVTASALRGELDTLLSGA